MTVLVFNIIGLLVLFLGLFREGSGKKQATAAVRKRIALISIPVVLSALFLSYFGILESAGGDLSGLAHVLEAGAIALLVMASFRFPVETGQVFLFSGLGFAYSTIVIGKISDTPSRLYLFSVAAIAVPQILSGVWLLLDTRVARGEQSGRAD